MDPTRHMLRCNTVSVTNFDMIFYAVGIEPCFLASRPYHNAAFGQVGTCIFAEIFAQT